MLMVFWTQLLCAQTPNLDFTLRYNSSLSRYEVYVRPTATQASFSWGPSQLSIVAPAATTPNSAFVVTTVAAGAWVDNSQVFAPTVTPTLDYHGVGSLGALVSLTANTELLVFHFTIPNAGCVPGLRLYVNGSDPNSNAAGMANSDFGNTVFAIVPGVPTGYESYLGNYDNGGTNCCPALASAPPNVSIINSTCNTSCTAAGGSIAAPTGTPCPAGSTLQYSVNNGANWTATLPVYAQSGPAQTIITRCQCDQESSVVSPSSTPVTTAPATCTPLTAFNVGGGGTRCTTDPGLVITLSGSQTGVNYQLLLNGNPVGTALAGTGNALSFPAQTAAGNYTVTGQSTTNACTATMSGTATITVNNCCPTLTTAPPNVSITNSTCNTSCVATGGSIAAPTGTPCPAGSTLQYSINNGANWTTTLPVYAQSGPAQTIITRCQCDQTSTVVSPSSAPVTTAPANCVLPTAFNVGGGGSRCTTDPGVVITLSGSQTGVNYQLLLNGSPVGGTVAGTGNALSFPAQTAAGTYTITGQSATNGCTATMSGTATITVNNCCPTLTTAPANVSIVNSTCNASCVATGGSIAAPTGTPCPAGSTLQYSVNNGVNWTTTLPVYAQSGPAQTVITRCQCDQTSTVVSPSSTPVTTAPANCVPPTAFAVGGGGGRCTTDGGLAITLAGSQSGVNYQLLLNGAPVGAAVTGTGSALSFPVQSAAGNYTVTAQSAANSCTATMSGTAAISVTNCASAVPVACGCKNNATTLENGQFDETITVNAPAGQTWTVTAVNGLYAAGSPAPPAAPTPIAVGATLSANGTTYTLAGVHIDAQGYTVTVSNGRGTSFTLANTCAYPNPVINGLDGTFCRFSPAVTLSGTPGDANITSQSFTVNGVAATVFDPSTRTPGNYTVTYTVNGGTPKANGATDPGCIQSVSKVVTIIATPSNVVCNDNVQLSLDEDCRVVVNADMILEGSYGCYDDYQVLITGPGGVNLGNVLTGANVGQTLKVKVTHLPSGNFCWGNIKVEDKLPPVLTCADVWAVCAAQNYEPNYLRNTLGIAAAVPTATDNCNLKSLTFIDNPTVDLDCNAPRINNREVSAYFVRKWTATDASGNTSTCEQFVYLERRHVWDVQFPADTEIACGSTGNPGVPYVVFNGVQLPISPSAGVCEFNVAATDQNLPVCDGTYKTIRTWVVYDWCLPTGSGTTPVAYTNPRYHIQVIKHVDNTGPVAQCPPALVVVGTDALKCCAAVDMPDVLVQDNCSRVNDISAMITVRDPLNNNAVIRMETVNGFIGDFPGNNWWTPDTMGFVGKTTCLTVGDHDVVYTITDDCGNQTSCNFTLSVRDYTPPIVACDEFTVGALDGDDPDDCYLPGGPCNFAGVAYIKAKTFDDGSYDNCKAPLKFTVRRMAPYSAFVEGLNKNDGIPPCDNGSGRPTEYERATLEQDSLKIYCGEVGTTQTVILRVYQLNVDGTLAVNPGTDPGTDDDEFIYGECMVQIEVQDKVRPTCIPPAHVTVSCENFDPSLWAYGKPVVQDNCCLDESKVYQDQCGLTHTPSYAQFDTTCNKGTITRTFRVYDCHGNTGSCTQRVVVTYEEDYYVRFPDDRIVTVCDGTGQYGAPTFFGEDCELLATSFKDDTFTVVPDACFKIERTWKIINWCTYDPNCDLTHIPNPNPNVIVNNSTNLPGPIVSDRCNAPTTDPWRSTRAKINPTDAVETNYCVFWQRPAACWPTGSKFNGYYYTQIIKVIDGKAPVPQCVKPDTCDLTDNDPLFWNVDYWWDATHSSHDLCEMPVDLKLTATDLCSGPNINFRYLLFLDLDGNGTMETVVSSSQLPPTNTIYYGNALLPNYQGGTPRAFDHRLVINPTLDWYRFAIQVTRSGANATAAVRFNTQRSPNTFVLPQIPHGKHKIKWIVEDGCGNETVCEYPFEVKDCKKPTIVCKPLSVNIMQTGMVTLWASDFLEYAFDNCTPASQLKLGVTTETTTNGVFPRDVNGNPITNVTFDCSQVGTQVIHLWSEDALGNADFCAVALLVQDNMGNCGAKATIAGALTTEKNDGVEEGDVRLQGSHPALPPISLFDFSDNKGHYEFSNAVPMLSNYTVTPVKEDNPFNGVSTLDLALISRHILGTELLNSPYKIIAADANKSGTVTTFDVVEFRKLILGIYDRLPDNASWRFVDKAYIFPNPAAPFAEVFPESKTVAAIQGNRLDDNFIGVKIGDVNGSAVANNLMQVDDRTNGTLYFDLEDRIVKAGEVVEAVFRAAEKNAGYQFTLKYDGLELLDIVPGERMGMEHFAIFAKENAFTTSFNGESKGEFKVLFRAKRTGDLSRMLSVSSSITKAEAYEERDGGIMVPQSVALRFNTPSGTTTVGLGFELYQNRPNPFINKTIIGFHLPETTKAILTVYDETGKLLHRQEGDFAKGYNHFSLDQKGVSTTGLLYYKVETATHSATKKMVQTQ